MGAVGLAVPLLVSALPGLGDYSNHLARMYVLTHIRTDPVLSRIYEVGWGVVPNLAMDLVVPPLAALVPLDVAGRLFIALALLLPVAGMAALHKAAFGTRSAWPLTGFLIAYNGLFFWGFLNFVVGLGLALLGTALWLREPPRGGALHLLGVSLLALVLFACHMEALGLFGVTIGCIELMRLRDLSRARRLTGSVVLRRGLRVAAPFIIPALLFLFAAPLAQGLTGKPLMLQLKEYYWAVYGSWRDGKLGGLGMPFASYSPLLDAAAVAVTVVLYGAQIRRHGCRVAPGLLLAAAVLMAVFPVIPNVWLTAANLDSRLPVYAAMLVVAGLAPNGPVRRPVPMLAAALGLLLAARAGIVAYAWAAGNAPIATCRSVMQQVAPGERVLVVTGVPLDPPPPRWQRLVYAPFPGSPAPLLTIDRQAFWPSLFTSRTLQPVHVIPPYRAIAVEQGEQPGWHALLEPTVRDLSLSPYLTGWRGNFDYVMAQPGVVPQGTPLDGMLRPLRETAVCSLYAVIR
jgi:hypothetical protein